MSVKLIKQYEAMSIKELQEAYEQAKKEATSVRIRKMLIKSTLREKVKELKSLIETEEFKRQQEVPVAVGFFTKKESATDRKYVETYIDDDLFVH